jgi:UDP-N-acetylmuramate: L-alanyl-gamma-D-glutamyl-meso-diaminopimelate ligase
LEAGADWQAVTYQSGPQGMDVTVHHDGQPYGCFHTPLYGRHNLQNLLAAIAVTHHLGLTQAHIASGLATYAHIKRRCEVRGTVDGVTVIDDFAHHPTAVQMTLEAVRMVYPTRRLWAVFEPRTATSRRRIFQQDYGRALQLADHILLADVHRKAQLRPAERLSPEAIVQGLRERAKDAWFYASTEAIIAHLCRETQASDVIVIMSNGGFENIHDRLLLALAQRSAAVSTPTPTAARLTVCPERESML